MEGELTAERVREAVAYGEAFHRAELPLLMRDGGTALGIDPLMAEALREMAGELGRGAASDTTVAYLRYIVGWWEQEESACLAVGLNYREQLLGSRS